MTQFFNDWYVRFLDLLRLEDIFLAESEALKSSAMNLVFVRVEGWRKLAELAFSFGFRWAAMWASHVDVKIELTLCLEIKGEYLLLRTSLPIEKPEISSWVNFYLAANRPERYLHDMFGVVFLDHPDHRRWIRHQAWNANQFPLRKNFLVSEIKKEPVQPDSNYPFFKVEGQGVCEIPVGPVHAGIIEPGHFRFHIAGEDVLLLEERLGYVHKGVEKIAEGRSIDGLIRLAGRVSGDSTVAHAWAAVMACENASLIEAPKRALYIRAVMLERERIANHLGDIGSICNDVGFAFGYYQFWRLRELCQRLNQEIFGHRLMMDCVIFSGVSHNISHHHIDSMLKQHIFLRKELTELTLILRDNDGLQDRLKTTGILTLDMAKKLGCLGYVGKASGCDYDVRRDVCYQPYDQVKVKVPVFKEGDVAARLNVRVEEILISLEIIEEFLAKMPLTKIVNSKSSFGQQCEGVGCIESWRGEILTYVSLDAAGRVTRFFPRDPSWLNWPALENLIHGNIVPDFPVCNKSVNGSYSGHDL